MDPKLLELLVCPVTKGFLDYDRDRGELLSRSARLAYPIRDGIPIPVSYTHLDVYKRQNLKYNVDQKWKQFRNV